MTHKAYELHPPEGESLTGYANSLVDGAESYNAHAVRYDGIGQRADRFNSNSCISSLIVAKGGATGLNDVRHISGKIDAGPVTLAGQKPALDDREMSDHVYNDSKTNHLIAPDSATRESNPRALKT